METCGIILAGGNGTRLGELTKVTNKHLLPVGLHPMIYHPVKKLAGAGIKEILIITGTEHMGDFVELLGSGRDFGCNFTYRVQDEAGGIAQALGLAEQFAKGKRSVVLLGDNIFQDGLRSFVNCPREENHAWIALKEVPDPHRYGVPVFDMRHEGQAGIKRIEEKPAKPKSNYAVTGIYSYPPDVFDLIKTLKPSRRGELEITDVNNHYVKQSLMDTYYLSGYWTDAGTFSSLLHANQLTMDNPPQFS